MKTSPLLSITSGLPNGYRIIANTRPAQPRDELLNITSRVRVTLLHQGIELLDIEVENKRFEARTAAAIEKLRKQAWAWHEMGPGMPPLWEAWREAKASEKIGA